MSDTAEEKEQDIEDTSPSSNWTAIIKVVKTPLSFYTLALLILQTILVFLMRKAEGSDFTILLISTLFLTLLILVIVGFIQYKSLTQREYKLVIEKDKQDYRYDVFLSSPMASLNDKRYREERNFALAVISSLKKDCGMQTIYYAGVEIDTKSGFDPYDVAVLDDLDAINNSRYFILIYPQKSASSVLFEAGCALALAKECIYFVKNRNLLPFLLRQAEQAFSNVKLYEYKSIDDVTKVCKNKKIFKFD